MVNFKLFGGVLPLLIGLLRIRAECPIGKGGNKLADENCVSGYYLLNENSEIVEANGNLYEYKNNELILIENPIPGFYKNSDTYIQCTSDTICKKITTSKGCQADSKNGELAKINETSFGVCIIHKIDGSNNEEYKTVEFEDHSNDNPSKIYVVSQDSDVFGFDANTHFVALKVTANSITFDPEAKDVVDQCVIANEGYLTSRKKDFCSPNSTGKYYNCTGGKCITKDQKTYVEDKTNYKEKKCEFNVKDKVIIEGAGCSVNGYHLSGANLIKCDNKGCEITPEIGEGLYWNDLQYNDIIKCDGSTCSNVNVKKSCTTAGDVVDTSYNLEVCMGKNASLPIAKLENGSYEGIFGNKEILYIIQKDQFSAIVNVNGKTSDKNYICTGGKCSRSVIEIKKGSNNSVTCTVTNGSDSTSFVNDDGEYITENDVKGYLVKTETSKCTVISTGIGYYVSNIQDSSSPLVFCNSDGCVLKANFAIKQGENKYILNASSDKPLIKCTRDGCKSIDGDPETYYLDASLNINELSLIYCTSTNSCSRVAITDRRAYESVKENVIRTDDEGNEVTEVEHSIIVCDQNCSMSESNEDEVYLNGGANSNNKPIIKEKKAIPGDINAVYINGFKSENEYNAVIFCSSTTKCSEITASSEDSIFIDVVSKSEIKLIKNDDPTPNEWKKFNIELNEGETKAYYISKTTNEVLKTNAEAGRLYVCTKEVANLKCDIPSSSGDYSSYYINFIENKLIQYKSSSITLLPETEDGYYINSLISDKVVAIKCTNNQCLPAEIDRNACGNSNIGKLLNTGKLCIGYEGSKAIEIELKGSTEKFLINAQSNSITSNSGYYIIEADNKKVTIIKNVGNYLVDKSTRKFVTAGTKESGVYSCKYESEIYSCSYIDFSNGNEDKYYTNDDTQTYLSYPVIYCSKDVKNCELQKKDTTEHYCLKGNKLMVCKPNDTNEGCEKDCHEESPKSGLYLGFYKNYLINCSGSVCGEYSNLNVGYYINNDVSKTDLIQCYASLNSIKCAEVKTIKDGYYIKEGNSLIKCTSNKCTTVNQSEGWYISGESGKAITYCSGTACTAFTSPKVGFYRNGDSTAGTNGNNLIKCILSSGTISCSEIKNNVGYYMNSGSSIDEKILIKCTSSGCINIETVENGYYVNGENSQLIYCDEGECSNFAVSGKGFYISANDGTAIISCDSSKKCTLDTNPGINGVYLNADPYKLATNPLIEYDTDNKEFVLKDDIINGWYKSAETDALTKAYNEAVIKCTSSTSCSYVAVKNVQCSKSYGGDFSRVNGSLQWCKTDGSGFINFEDSTIIAPFSSNDKIPGVSLPPGVSQAYALLKVNENSILPSVAVDGYKYDEGSLYYCPKDKKGICTIVTEDEFTTGIYLDHKYHDNDNNVIVCEKVIENDSNGKPVIVSKNCNYKSVDNVKYDTVNKKYILDLNSDNDPKFEEIKSDYMYLLSSVKDDQEKYNFPGIENRYFRATVNKYYIKLIEDVEEPPKDKFNNDYTNIYIKKYFKIGDNGEKEEEYGNPTNDGDYYDYDTNYGYYIYSKNNGQADNIIENYDLNKVFIYINNNEEFKYECDINDICVKRKLADVAVEGYNFDPETKVLQATYVGSNNIEDVKNEIKKGSYLNFINGQKIRVDCDEEGNCKQGDNIRDLESSDKEKIGFMGGKFGFLNKDGVFIEASKRVVKYGFQQIISTNILFNKRDDNSGSDNLGEIMEMSHVSFTSTTETRNIFISKNSETDVDKRSIMITVENLDVGEGYTCIKGVCKKISSNEDITKYYINTVQTGNDINAYAVCGESCKLETVSEGQSLLFENAAATGMEDALISCNYGSGCQTVAITGTTGLPLCKDIKSINGNQYCVENGKILKGGTGSPLTKEVYVFDVTYQLISNPEKLQENHIYASMYYCKENNECVQTYGYVKGDNGYSKFTKSGSEFINYDITKSCAVSGTGSFIQGKLCIDENNLIELNGSDENYYYYELGINTEGAYPEVSFGNKILVCNKKNYVFTIKEDGYISVDKSDKKIAYSFDRTNVLYKCDSESSNCNLVNKPVNGYYLSSYIGKVIKCEDSKCNNDVAYIYDSKNKYNYINVEIELNNNVKLPFNMNSYTYIEKNFPGYLSTSVIVKSNPYKLSVLITENYILMNEKLYLCNSRTAKCSEEQNIKPGWYVSGSEDYRGIKCVSGECTIVKELNSKCSDLGELIFNVKDNTYQFCSMKSTTNPIKIASSVGSIINLKTLNGNNYKDNKFPNEYNVISVNGNSVIGIDKISNDDNISSYIQLNTCHSTVNTINGQCKDTNNKLIETNQFCIYNEKLYQTKKDSNNVYTCEKIYATENIILLNGAEEVNDVSSSEPPVTTRMYYCDGEKCSITTGYKKLEKGGWVKCDFNECEKRNELPQLNGVTIVASEGLYYYFDGDNEFPGGENIKKFLVKSGKDYLLIFKGDGYYLLNENNRLLKDDSEPPETSNSKRSVDYHGLYLCESSSSSCIKVEEPGNGYYINAATVNSKKTVEALIVCKDGKCSIATQSGTEGTPSDITFKTGSCTESLVGGLIRDTSKKVVKLCVSKSQAVSFTSSATQVKYYFINIVKGNAFGEISVTGDKDSANILVKVTNRSITQVVDTGYILYNSSNSEIVEGTGSSKILYNCETKDYTEGKNTVICSEESNLKNGWYFNDYYKDKRYVSCEEGTCKVLEAVESLTCSSSGSLIYNDGKFKLCKTLLKQVDIKGSKFDAVVKISDMKQFPSIKSNDIEVVLNVNRDSVVMTKWNGYKVVDENDLTIIETANTKGLLYKCEEKNGCNRILLPNDNWYLKKNETGFATELINCNGGYGSNCEVTKKPTEGFFVSADINSPIIQCIQPGDEINGVFEENGDVICYDRPYRDGWFKNAANVENQLIFCSKENGCKEKTNPENGWYINTGKESVYGNEGLNNSTTVYPLIKCSNNECNNYGNEIGKTCSKGGEVIVVNNNYRLCRNEKDSVDISKATGVNSVIVNVANYDDYPGATGGLILVDVNKFGAVLNKNSNEFETERFYYKDKVMYKCDAESKCTVYSGEDKEGVKVYEQVTKNLYTGSNCSNTACSWNVYSKEEIIFLDKDYKLVKGIGDDNSEIKYVYKCKKTDSKLGCNPLYYFDGNGEVRYYNGYYYNANHVDNGKNVNTLYKCDDNVWSLASNDKDHTCTLLNYKKNTCYISYTDELDYNDENNDGYNIEAGKMCKTSNGKFYFAISEINTGIDKSNCLSLPSDNSVSYYKIGNEVYTLDKYGAYIVSGIFINSNDSSIINASNDSGDGSWLGNNEIINCENKKCTNDKIISCSYELQTGKCKISSGSLQAGKLCLSEEGNTYIALENVSTSGGKCTKYKNEYLLPDDYKVSDNILTRNYGVKYYLLNKKVYAFSNGQIQIYKNGIYTIDNDNNSISIAGSYEMDISQNSKYQFILCSDSGCERRTKCNNNNEIEYIFDKGTSKVIVCDPAKNTIKRINTSGFYLNKPWNSLIKCIDGICKEINSKNGKEGYYKDTGNSEKMIECKRNNDVFTCSEEEIIKCTFNENEKSCTSNIDLLRNSYCYYSVVDKNVGKIDKLVYVENFIKAGKSGKCVTANENEYFYYYENSKFMKHNEKVDLIKVSSEYICSIYEPDIGYYIIDTKNGMGITENTHIGKSRFYECSKNGCKENRNPNKNKLYINKASSERLVGFTGSVWNVVKESKCTIGNNNTKLCKMGGKIYANDIVYRIDDNDVKLYVAPSIGNSGSEMVNVEKLVQIKPEKFIIDKNNIYLLNKEMQSFDGQSEKGYYIFESTKTYNLDPYSSSKNVTLLNNSDLSIYEINEVNDVSQINYESMKHGYYLNKANQDVIIQNMEIYKKSTPDNSNGSNARKRDQGDDAFNVIKSVNNVCTSNRRNVCVNTNESQVIPRGSVCVVKEGEFQGMYLATGEIRKNSATTNCVRYEPDILQYVKEKPTNICTTDNGYYLKNVNEQTINPGGACAVSSGKYKGIYISYGTVKPMEEGGFYKYDSNVYQYIKEKTEMVGKTYEKIIVNVGKNSIIPFDDSINDNTNVGYYVYDENKLKLYNDSLKQASAYLCDYYKKVDEETGNEEITGFGCDTVNNLNQFLRDNNENLLLGSGSKWKIETNTGYYFFNEKGLPATTIVVDENNVSDEIYYRKWSSDREFDLNGRYLNSAVTNKPILVKYENDLNAEEKDKSTISDELKLCSVSKDGTCKSTGSDALAKEEVCYDKTTKKLYLVDVKEAESEDKEPITICVTGGDIISYSLIGSQLYKLDGLSVKKLTYGYYILDENMQKFTSNYPRKPYKIIKCEDEGNCDEVTEPLKLNQEVIINSAIKYSNDGKSWLRYFNAEKGYGTEKFMDLNEDGKCYCLNKEGLIPNEEEGTNKCVYTKGYCSNYGFVVNYAAQGESMVLKDGGYNEDKKCVYDEEKDVLKYYETYNESYNNVYMFVGDKLYSVTPKQIYIVGIGLYLTINGRPFDNTEWTSLSGKEVCYYYNGKCDQDKLKNYMPHSDPEKLRGYMNKYVINMANGSIVTYDEEKDTWRTVREDGVYFFFENKDGEVYSINIEDRRPSQLIEIKNGQYKRYEWILKDGKYGWYNIINKEGNSGFYEFEGMIVEKREKEWMDAVSIVSNVNVNGKRKCTAIETNENINVNEYCYNEGYGICIVKSLINDSTISESNCMFSDNNKKYFTVVNNELYLVSSSSYNKVSDTGLYVIGQDNLAYDSKKEGLAYAYSCVSGKCNLIKDLESQYYFNRASDVMGEYSILYYNKESKSWRKAVENGKYIFSNDGYPLKEGASKIEIYEISENGIYVNNLSIYEDDESYNGKFVSKSKPDELVSVEYKKGKPTVKTVSKCTIESNKEIKSKVKLDIGDICNASGELVIITGLENVKRDGEEGEAEIEQEYSYSGEVAKGEDGKIIYLSNEKKFAKFEGERVSYVSYDGYVIIDKSTGDALDSVKETNCVVYKCSDEEVGFTIENVCELVEKDKLKENNHYINDMTTEYPFVKYLGNEKWKGENEIGYYFLDENMNNVGNNTETSIAFEVFNVDGVVKQKNIINDNVVGFYLNKAKSNNIVISNNKEYYSEGSDLKVCNITVTESGIVCRTMAEGLTYAVGDYCTMKNSKQLYLLTGEATYSEEEEGSPNCIYGTNKEPLYVFSKDNGQKLNGVTLESSLIQLDSDAIRVAKDGYYLVNQNNTLVSSEEANNEEVELSIYGCVDGNCELFTLGDDEKIMTSEGEIIELDEEGKYVSIKGDGIYFFNNEGNICSETGCIIDSIIRISENGKKRETLAKDALAEGAYINEGDDKAIAVYSNKSWSIESVGCTYEEGLCINYDIDFKVGSYCVFEGKFYVITEINKENEERKCLPGKNGTPLFFKSTNGKLMTIEEKSIQAIEEDGYYALTDSFVPFESEELAQSKLIKCEDERCNEIDPEIGSYLNKSPKDSNVVQYPTGSNKESKTLNNTCEVVNEGEKYIVSGENISAGDVCINSETLYLVDEESKGYKVEKSVVSYQFVNGKLYMLNDDAVIQKSDGYFFITKDNRAITNKKDYSKKGTVGYMCSKKGECFLIEPIEVSYFPDYTTKSNKKFNVVKFDPSKKNLRKRQEETESNDTNTSEEGSSGYDTVDEEGILKMDDGSYAQCEYDEEDEISCHEIDEKGTYETNDGEIITCTENEDGEVECSQATEGGYYWIDDDLYECEPNEEGDGLECQKVDKEGYFLAEPDGVLYECKEKEEETEVPEEATGEVEASKVYGDLDADGEGSDPEVSDTTTSETETTTTTTEETTTSTTTEETTTTSTLEATPTPLDVTCTPITDCELEEVVPKNEEGEENNRVLYVCKNVDGKNKYVPDDEDCDSGNYIKKEGGYYECEDEKDDVEETNIEQPNTDHTSKTSTTDTKTTTTDESKTDATTTSATTTSSESSTSSQSSTEATTTSATTSQSSTTTTSTTSAADATTTTTTKSSTTTTAPTATTTTAGARSIIRTLPSLSFYLFLFVFSYYIFF